MDSFYNIKIAALTAVVPKETIDNEANAAGDKYMQKVVKMTGVHKRHYIPMEEKTPKDYAVKAAELAIQKAGVKKEDVKFLVYVTQSPDIVGPSTALMIHNELELPVTCMAFDMNLGCTGFVGGMQVLSSMVSTCDDDNAAGIVVVSDALTNEPRDNANDAILFGDAATAALLVKDSESEMKIRYCSDGSRFDTIIKRKSTDNVYMDGDAVFQFSISEVPEALSVFMADNSITNDTIDYFVSHQAQDFIIKHAIKKISVDKEKVLYSLGEYGNTSGSSIPMTICANIDSMKQDTKILATGFGVGLAWGFIYFTIDKDNILPVEEL